MNDDILLSIIISTKGTPWAVLSRTLGSILDYASSECEVLVIDQNTVSPVKPAIKGNKKYSGVIYINSDKTGLSRGRNTGIRRARGNWLLFFDDDAVMPPETLPLISDTLREQRDETIVYFGEILTLESGRPYLRKSAAAGSRIGLFNFDSVCSIALIFNRKAILEAGFFDNNLGAGEKYGAGEESDIILRTLKHGIRIERLEGFTVLHPEAGTADPAKRFSYGMGTGAMYRKHIFSSPVFFLFLSLKFMSELLLRSLLILRHVFSKDIRMHHYRYMQGCLNGFSRYRK